MGEPAPKRVRLQEVPKSAFARSPKCIPVGGETSSGLSSSSAGGGFYNSLRPPPRPSGNGFYTVPPRRPEIDPGRDPVLGSNCGLLVAASVQVQTARNLVVRALTHLEHHVQDLARERLEELLRTVYTIHDVIEGDDGVLE